MLVPLLISRHVHRTTRYLSIQINDYKRLPNSTKLGVGFRRNRRVRQDELLIALASPKDDPKIAELLAAIDDPLLRCKATHTWELFHEPRRLLKSLLESKRRLEWHLSRIYRARNMLVHEGIETVYIVPLLDNLQNYLSMLVQRLIHEMQSQPDWSIRQVVSFWNGRMNHILCGLDAKNGSLLMTDDFLEQVRNPKRIWSAGE